VQTRFDALRDQLDLVGDSRGRGAMRALELVEDQASRRPLPAATVRAILDDCVERGLVVIKAGIHDNVIRTLMPLTIPDAELDQGLGILSDVLTMWDRRPRK
jgi:4-aminobutyrate aminotransferase/(S)-3-amino-2-methylpropionate transaminase